MSKWKCFPTLVSLLLVTLTACAPSEAVVTVEPSLTPRVISLEEELAEEERAAEALATIRAERTQIASRVSPYVRIFNEEESYLAFWFHWNDETVFLPLSKVGKADDIGLASCELEPEAEIFTGKLLSGWDILQDTCSADQKAAENSQPIIRIPRYFNDGVKIVHRNEPNASDWNIIDLNGEYVENFSEVVTIIVENDLLGSGDLNISLYRMDGPNDKTYEEAVIVPTYTLPADMLQLTFSNEQLENFEYADDVVYALEREFTWNIPEGFDNLNLSPGDENLFVIIINENGREVSKAYIQVREVINSEIP